ncbi:MAG: hypothetical protein A3F14_05515 [Gammaproteobacteria bacterium RIFCSPHIGHO2_12_FULL_43_28]|nr:MAG: hypothetical protein A3F14_05515 [Gammaproteobacteria bacterium RIFCSPHIGHO2_12_FULL_43_28]
MNIENTYTKLFQRLTNLNTTHICDALPNVRLLDSSIHPITHHAKLIGRSVTVNSNGESLSIIKALQENCHSESVMVIDACNAPHALIGGIFATAAKQKGIRGVVLDGNCRDINEMIETGLPIFVKGKCAKTGKKNKIGSTQEAITCGGVTVLPDEVIFGDDDGVVVLSVQEATDAIPLAESIKHNEEVAVEKLKNGLTLVDIYNFTEHYQNIESGNMDSKFGMTL